MKKLLILITLMITMQSVIAAPNYVKKTYDVETRDGHLIKAYLTYPNTKKATYPTVLLLHSIGYTSAQWGELPSKLNEAGYAVITMDFRGYGKSVYDNKFRKKSWIYFKKSDFSKYPNDVIDTLNYIRKNTKKASFNHWAIIGGDIGANTAVLVARFYPQKPRALVLISPTVLFKGLYIPIALTEIGKMPIMAIASVDDRYMMNEQARLERFAQGEFKTVNVKGGGSGMLLLKTHPELVLTMCNWVTNIINNVDNGDQ